MVVNYQILCHKERLFVTIELATKMEVQPDNFFNRPLLFSHESILEDILEQQ